MNLKKIVKQIESYRDQMVSLTDDGLRAKTNEFKSRYDANKKNSLQKLLP